MGHSSEKLFNWRFVIAAGFDIQHERQTFVDFVDEPVLHPTTTADTTESDKRIEKAVE